MNWVTTNLGLPENLYMELKMKAARERKSVAAVIREKLVTTDMKTIQRRKGMVRELEKFSQKLSAKSPVLI